MRHRPAAPCRPFVVRLRVRPALRSLGARFLLRGWLAITIGRTVISWRPLDPPELAHELEHVRQWQRHGPLGFVARYAAASLRAALEGGHWYRDNAFERAAGRAAARAAEIARSGCACDPPNRGAEISIQWPGDWGDAGARGTCSAGAPQLRARCTEKTSLTCSSRERTRASCATDETCSVAFTVAVWSGRVSTCAATMFTFCSATTFVMSESSPVRSYASRRIAIG